MVGTWQAPTVRTKLVHVRFELMCVFEAKHRVARRLLPPTPRPVTVKLFQVQVGRLRSVARTQTDLSHRRWPRASGSDTRASRRRGEGVTGSADKR